MMMISAHAGMAGDEAGARGHVISAVCILCAGGPRLHKMEAMSDVACSAVIVCLGGVCVFCPGVRRLSGLRGVCVLFEEREDEPTWALRRRCRPRSGSSQSSPTAGSGPGPGVSGRRGPAGGG